MSLRVTAEIAIDEHLVDAGGGGNGVDAYCPDTLSRQQLLAAAKIRARVASLSRGMLENISHCLVTNQYIVTIQ